MNIDLKTWNFNLKNDESVDLVLSGKKTANTSIYNGDINDIGSELVLIYDNEKQACITKTIKNIICKFNEVGWEIAKLEGENNNLEDWKKEHNNYFKTINKDFNDDTLVLIEIFEVIRNLKQERLEIGNLIAANNQEVLGKIKTIEEINAGYNNTIFSVNNKYIIKVCGNNKEDLFDVESNFYNENKNNPIIPKLYKFDKSKSIVPYVYEIIEKIDGKSIYYHWYKWDESKREEFIKTLMDHLQNIHTFKEVEDTWCNDIKNKIIENYEKCKELFTEEEQEIVEKAFDRYDEFLSDNHYSLIHNDLHFDNIFLTNNNEIKLIDFNDSIIAPFDYDLRILFMCKTRPWKWANTEMDPYQKPEDYIHIIEYIKKHYKKLSIVKFLDERMYIYEILSDIKHLPKYKLREQIDTVVEKSKKILKLY